MAKTVKVTYNAETLETSILIEGIPFDTARISGREIADWAYPFMMRRIKWNGFYQEMTEALGGETEFNLVFEGSEQALNELKESWEDAPVHIVPGEKTAVIVYDENTLSVEITVNNAPFDISRINGRNIEDWIYPFMMRKIKWDGIFQELASAFGSEEYTIRFSGSNASMRALMDECPDTVEILKRKTPKKPTASAVSAPRTETVFNAVSETALEEIPETELVRSTHIMYFDDEKSIAFFQQLLERANAGDSSVLMALGDCYRFGKGTEQSYEESVKCYARLAEQEDAYAQFEVGCCLYHGEGVIRNHTAALEFYFSSAELGNGVAVEMLQFLAEKGDAMAEELLEKSETLPPSYRSGYHSLAEVPDISGSDAETSEEIKQAVKFGVKVGSGVLKIAGAITGAPLLGETASVIEKTAIGIIDGDFSSALNTAVGFLTGQE